MEIVAMDMKVSYPALCNQFIGTITIVCDGGVICVILLPSSEGCTQLVSSALQV